MSMSIILIQQCIKLGCSGMYMCFSHFFKRYMKDIHSPDCMKSVQGGLIICSKNMSVALTFKEIISE